MQAVKAIQDPHLHFHCVVIDGVFASDPAGGVIFHAATGLDEQAFAAVQERPRGSATTSVRSSPLPPKTDG